MKNFCKDLKEHATKTVNYEKKEMMPLTIEENKLYHEHNIDYIYKQNLVLIMKNIIKSEIIVIILENMEVLLMIFAT